MNATLIKKCFSAWPRLFVALFALSSMNPATATEIVESVDKTACEFVKRSVCSTKRRNAYERCQRWHRISASRVGATHIVLTGFKDRNSFLFFGSGDQLDADYFNCSGSRTQSSASGSGFFVTENCHLVTNDHVIAGFDHVSLTLHDGESVSAKVVSRDPSNDIAILKGDCSSTPMPLKSSSDSLKGHSVFTIGYPLIQLQGPEQKISFGHINADSGIQGDIRFLQIDIPVQPGNSGGPLMDEYGNVVGIVTARLNELKTLQETGSLPQNVNYAVKIDYLFPLLRYIKVSPNMAVAGDEKSSVRAITESGKSVALVTATSN